MKQLLLFLFIMTTCCLHSKALMHIRDYEHYLDIYQESIRSSDLFWQKMAGELDWFQKPSKTCSYEWDTENKKIEHTWFEDGWINASYNCIDRHLKTPDKPAIIWQGDLPEEVKILTFKDLQNEVCRCANALKSLGVSKGDRVCLYMPMVPELAVAMLACARIGAVHSVVFGGFSAESLAHRIVDADCKVLITANVLLRGGKQIALKEIVDEALFKASNVHSVVVVQRTKEACNMVEGRDVFYDDLLSRESTHCPAEPLPAEHPLFILYTSGSTGKPKGVVHSQAGYLLHTALSHKYIFDIRENDVYWCTADLGWISGHSYVIYGPLANGATTLMFEGTPLYPHANRYWEIIEKFKVSVFYTSPTAIRTLIKCADEHLKSYDLSSLKILGSVGEPINPEAWDWYFENIGKSEAPIMDTWWQTETGGIMITPLPAFDVKKPGCAMRPFFGVEPVVLKENGMPCKPGEEGYLCIKKPWPGIMRTTWGDHKRFVDTYFTTFRDVYYTGDACRVDEDGDFWLLGRVDDVVNVSGHRLGTAELESAIMSFNGIAEAAVVGFPHDIKGQGLYAFVVPVETVENPNVLKTNLVAHVRKQIGSIAILDVVHMTKALPKTRSGKVMRRILRKIAEKEFDAIGDTSTLADPSVIEQLIEESILQSR